MARRNKVIINSNKHYVGQSISTIVGSSISNRVIADAVVAPATGTSFDVEEGSIVKAVFVEIWAIGLGTSNDSSFNMTVEKISSDGPAMTLTNAANLGAYQNKKNILYTTQGLVGQSDSGATGVALMRQWIAIPKGKQRMGLGDRIVLNLANLAATDFEICGIFIFKEYR